ncbi:uncharacterized protein PGTG_22573 [Puccinia graminis f. sp. tritici CRL 75-36-700-3]|uniref:Secreted protein n=1 Tax=Puccinia graminis f. sp. tritici (strain CRL 75-36-700-3 / race SCCL) TaxID=418459 RepID=H6QUY6_PUCGT|nr:uncharacterized protein PGTG_22573 [Puccinia graminis f. sp. tritici CRL 75-36-700-3]EHS62599.1 hypothetical protein PGTG_22573 [Puccinia graminis f. sp. tritici CRL 75-36-700-3]
MKCIIVLAITTLIGSMLAAPPDHNVMTGLESSQAHVTGLASNVKPHVNSDGGSESTGWPGVCNRPGCTAGGSEVCEPWCSNYKASQTLS